MEPENLADLIQRAQARDLAAQEELVERFQGRIAGFVHSLTGERDAVADLTQQVFIKMLGALRGLKSPGQFSPWLFKIARNVCRDHFRARRWRGLFMPFAGEHEEIASNGEPEVFEGAEWLMGVVRLLPEGQRELVLMRYQEGLSYEEMAGITGSTVESVRGHLKRAREHLIARRKQKYGNE